MRLGFIILMATATLAVSVAANSEQSKLAAVAAQNALQSVGDVPQKNARFLRTSTTEEDDEEEDEERGYNYPFLVSEEGAKAMGQRIEASWFENLLNKVSHISNGENILKRWKSEDLTLPQIKSLLKEADKWYSGSPERAVYKIVKREQA